MVGGELLPGVGERVGVPGERGIGAGLLKPLLDLLVVAGFVPGGVAGVAEPGPRLTVGHVPVEEVAAGFVHDFWQQMFTAPGGAPSGP
ncbi:hypothetical protein PV343_03775 [Streptomyces sp. WI03-4A]|uniref:hypothetical protein n=1 Tax=Streptomyces sp. WI03-4A TaxID=3028706 RepID=UPI0029AA8BE8|nr:hypothetical protein [Streptomyces sp. WI03-4A]MDX2591410.1 hypothetical protein [Streptomyces sp. WI03-4A]